MPEQVLQEFKPWASDSAGEEINQKIQQESKYISALLLFNMILTFLAALFHFIPVENDDEVFFAFMLFSKWFPKYGVLLNWFYRSTFFVLAFVMITPIHQFIYVIEQIKFQIFLLASYMRIVTDLPEQNTNNINDCDLLKNSDYQRKVEQRIKFCVKRHVELLQ
jgi:hypothetical protein